MTNHSRQKHFPERTCIGCGGKKNKWLMLRMAMQPPGDVVFDLDNRLPGRGTYVCTDEPCLRRAIARKSFDRAFRRHITPEVKLLASFPGIRAAALARMDKSMRLAEITRLLEKNLGEPKWDGRQNPLDTLILTILSQSTNDRNRDLAYQRLRDRFPQWEQVTIASPAEIAQAIRPAGLANQKSGRIRNVLLWVRQNYGSFDLQGLCGQDPETVKKEFLQLKGVGIKTISVVLMVCCGADIFPVDTHVHRICKRLGLVPAKTTAEKTHALMQPLVPPGKSYSLHMNMLILGRKICLARVPKCATCPVGSLCPSRKEEIPANHN